MSDNNHKGHYAASLGLLDTVFTAIKGNFEKKQAISLSDIDECFEKIRGFWPKLEPIFDATCRECPALIRAKSFVPDSRRRDFVTRLIFSRILTGIPPRDLAHRGRYPNVLAPGIQANVQAMLPAKEYAIYNDLSRSIFVEAGTDKDDAIWQNIAASESLTISTHRIFLRLLVCFRNFNTRHWEFLRLIQGAVGPDVCKVDDVVFCELFEALFGEYEQILAREDNRLRFDLYYGESTVEQARTVLLAYQRFRQGVDGTPTASRRAPVFAGARR